MVKIAFPKSAVSSSSRAFVVLPLYSETLCRIFPALEQLHPQILWLGARLPPFPAAEHLHQGN